MSVKFFGNPIFSHDARNEHCFGISINDNDEIESVIISSHDYKEFVLIGMPRLKQFIDSELFPDRLKFDKQGNLVCDEVKDIHNLPTWHNLGTESMVLSPSIMHREAVRHSGARYALIAIAPKDMVLFDADDFMIISASRKWVLEELASNPDCIANVRISKNADGSVRAIIPINKSTIQYLSCIPWTFKLNITAGIEVPIKALSDMDVKANKYMNAKLSACVSFGDLSRDVYFTDIVFDSKKVSALAHINQSVTIEQLNSIEEMQAFVKSYVQSISMGDFLFKSVDIEHAYINPAARPV